MTTNLDTTIRYLTGAEVDELSRGLGIVALVRDTLLAFRRGTAGLTPEAALRWTTPTGAAARSLILPGWSGTGYGCKIINSSLGNHELGIPRAAGLIVLADPETAHPSCVMEGARISALRTAGVSLAAVEAVRGLTSITSVAFLGCGRQARAHQELLLAECPGLERVLLYDRDPASRERLAAEWRRTAPGVDVRVVEQPREAVAAAGLTIAATTTTESYVELDWLPEGATFVNVSLDDASESLLTDCDHLFVDDWELVSGDDHRLLGRLSRSGRVSGPGSTPPPGGRAVDAELPALLAGEYTRPIGDRDRVVVNPFGMGVHDIALADVIHAKAVAAGVGTRLPR
ncbi:ornithine cyclodeaminase [Streptomyces vinaceus]|uniref:Ornithine cyclodeaminase n=1 Tax=Streptomyces vinaceus TaxID=1960 RepID=A0A5J6JL32_STRVI|nr:ornithine cyclodeaminase [Streptomyces vinaceus]QEV48486.1 ornithine cyclodeaminase [Streptomyces vinaceus]GHE74500.1 ornithine cyclodeaminase [Streptomyces vinaceus]